VLARGERLATSAFTMIHDARGYLDLQVNRSTPGQSPMMTDRSRFLASVSSSSALISLEEARGGAMKRSREKCSNWTFYREADPLSV